MSTDTKAARLAVHQALAPQWMSLFNAVGGTQAGYDEFLDRIVGAALSAHTIPAADTETEVQWGVQGTDLSTRTIVIEVGSEDSARYRAKESARKGGDFVAVCRKVTPWEEA